MRRIVHTLAELLELAPKVAAGKTGNAHTVLYLSTAVLLATDSLPEMSILTTSAEIVRIELIYLAPVDDLPQRLATWSRHPALEKTTLTVRAVDDSVRDEPFEAMLEYAWKKRADKSANP